MTIKERILRWFGAATVRELAATIALCQAVGQQNEMNERDTLEYIRDTEIQMKSMQDTIKRIALKVALDDVTKSVNDR